MHTTTINTPQLRANDISSSTRFVRTASAADAQGFAQIMQAFDAESEIAESIVQSQDSDQASSDQRSADETTQGGPSTATSESGADSQGGDDLSNADTNPDALTNAGDGAGGDGATINPKAVEPGQGTNADDAAMRLLENQGDQAKMTIKGLARSLTHAADANLTNLAVDTRLGRNTPIEPSVQPQQAVPAQPTPEQSQPLPANTTAGDPSASRHEPQVSSQIHGAALSSETVQRSEVGLKDQAGADAQQARGQRVDAASMASQVSSATKPAQPTVSTPTANPTAVLGQSSASSTARAITGVQASAGSDVGAGSVTQRQTDTNAGSLVEKMKSSELPSETKRAGVLAQVQRGLASLLRTGNNEMVLKLSPGNLGEVRIHIKSKGDRLTIRFETTSAEATEHLNASTKDLGSAMRAKGISIEQIQVEQSPTHDPSIDGAASESGSSSAGQDRAGSDQNNAQQRGDSTGVGEHESNDDSTNNEPQPIWTELGLDAIA